MEKWADTIQQALDTQVKEFIFENDELTIEVEPDVLIAVARRLRDEDELHFEQLIDICGVDYIAYGQVEWETNDASGAGFSRAVEQLQDAETTWDNPRFAVVYHLLSLANNQRVRLRVYVPNDTLMIPSVTSVWASANWYEREAFDLFGIRFEGHDDLRRILTDYGFVGYPFRKDFPLIGHVELRFDAELGRCVYEPVSIEPRTLVPRVIRHDSRLETLEEEKK